MAHYRELRRATFSPNLSKYFLLTAAFTSAATIVLLPITVVVLLAGKPLVDAYIRRLACILTERTLEIRRGWITRVESTIPLDRITDLQVIQGPIMRVMKLHAFKVETAGGSAGAGSYLVSLVGIEDTYGFREAVLAQRDRMSGVNDGGDGGGPRVMDAGPASGPGSLAQVERTLVEIRDLLKSRA